MAQDGLKLSKGFSVAALRKLIADCNLAMAQLDGQKKTIHKFRDAAIEALAEVEKAKARTITFVRKSTTKRRTRK